MPFNYSCCVCFETRKRNSSLSFFKFPKDETRCQLWLDVLGLGKKGLTCQQLKNKRVCEVHFDVHHLGVPSTKRKLLSSAVPTKSINTKELEDEGEEEVTEEEVEGEEEVAGEKEEINSHNPAGWPLRNVQNRRTSDTCTVLPDANSLLFYREEDVHTCGSCRTEFHCLEEFIHHKVFVEGCRLFYCPSRDDPSISVPHFMPSWRDDAPNKHGNSNMQIVQEEHHSTKDEIVVMKDDAVKKLYPCKICGQAYSKEVYTQRHFDLVHQKETNSQAPFRCSKCGTSFKRSQTLRVHWLTHSQNRKFHCPYTSCHFAFKTKGSLVRHIRRHTGEKPFLCHHCNRRFSESGALSRHLKSCLSGNQKNGAEFSPYNCIPKNNQQGNLIGNVTKSPIDVNRLEIEENAEIYVICVQGNNQNTTLENPVIGCEVLTNEADEPAHCPICGKQFKLKNGMRKHLMGHSAERRFACGICNKRYKRSGHIKEHLMVHKNRGRQVCHVCSRDFKTPKSLKAHLGTHTTELHYACTHCGHRFRTKNNMMRHMVTHNRNSTASENQHGAE